MELTPQEQVEYEYQLRELASPWYHSELKCDTEFVSKDTLKRHARLKRNFCPVHKVIVNYSGWEVGFCVDGRLSDLNK